MTAPSAPGVALYEGAFGVTRGPDGKGGEVVGPMAWVQPTSEYGWALEGATVGRWDAEGEDGNSTLVCGTADQGDIIHVEPTREKAEAWLCTFRDAQDRAPNPERRRAVAEVPEGGWGAEVLPAKPFNPVDWTPTPAPQPADAPVVDWEALARGAVECLKTVRDYVDDAHTGHLTYKRGRLDEKMTGEDLARIDALIAAMKGERG